jgi:hypothetical protein
MARRLVLMLLLLGCSSEKPRVPPALTLLSPSLITFEGAASSVTLQTDRRARFSVLDAAGHPRGAAVAQGEQRIEVPFDTTGLEGTSTLRVVGVSDSGGRTETEVAVVHGIEGITALADPPQAIRDAALLTDGRVAVVADGGVFLQRNLASIDFQGPLAEGDDRRSIAAGADGDFFVGGGDDVVVHYDETGAACDRITLPPTQVEGGESASTGATAIVTQFGAGDTEVAVAHDLGFAGFNFSHLTCAESCASDATCDLQGTSAFSTGSCVSAGAREDFRATAVALDGDRLYTGGFTFNLWSLADGRSQCIDLGQTDASVHPLTDIVLSGNLVWIAVGSEGESDRLGGVGLFSFDRSFEAGPPAPAPGRVQALPDDDLLSLGPLAGGGEGVWFGTASGAGRLVETGDGSASIDWISGYSLPGRQVRAVLQPPDRPEIVWLATDAGLARFNLP